MHKNHKIHKSFVAKSFKKIDTKLDVILEAAAKSRICTSKIIFNSIVVVEVVVAVVVVIVVVVVVVIV